MIGQLIAMFIIGMGVMFCICAILFLRFVEPLFGDQDTDFYPTDEDMDQMSLWYEEEYHGKHE